MKTYRLKLTFTYDDGNNDTVLVELTVPDGVELETVRNTLNNGHNYLCMDDDSDRYGKSGRTPETLLNYICEKNGWEWDKMKFDLEMSFN